MKEQFVTYEIALKLKELGFDEECLAIYTHNNEHYTAGTFFLHTPHPFTIEELIPEVQDIRESAVYILAPLWQQAIDWLFSNGIAVQFWFNTNTMCWCTEDVFNHNTGKSIICEYLERPSLYEIREHAILKAIELCKNN